MSLRSKYEPPVPVVVLAEGAFGTPDGKTANGVVMHSELFDAHAVVDSRHAGASARDVVARPTTPDVPVVESIAAALEAAPAAEALILGVAPAGGHLPAEWTADIRTAMAAGCDVVSGLHVLLSEEPGCGRSPTNTASISSTSASRPTGRTFGWRTARSTSTPTWFS